MEDADAPQHFFRDLAAQNDAAESSFEGSLPTSALPKLPKLSLAAWRHLDIADDQPHRNDPCTRHESTSLRGFSCAALWLVV